MGLALLAGLLHVVLLPATPAAAAASDRKLASWNTWDGKSDTLKRIPGLIKDHDVDVVALQEVADGNLLGHAPATFFDIASLSPSGTPQGNWRVDEFHWDDGITVYRIRTGSNRRSIAIATKERVASHDDLHLVEVRGDASGKAFPAFGIKLGGNWYYSIHASTQAKRSNNNADTLVEDISGLHKRDGFKAPWAIMGDFNRFPDEKSKAFINQQKKLKESKKRKFAEDQGALTSVLDLEANERVVFSGAPTHKKGAELDFMVDGGAAAGYSAKRLKTLDGSDHYRVIFEKDTDEPDTCVAGDGSGASRTARAAADDLCPVESGLPAATVSLGDSYISGEGGRWQGNANAKADGPDGDLDPNNDAWGTDRAAHGTQVYEKNAAGSDACHRSDVAEIKGAAIGGVPKERRFNIACSGAETQHILSEEFQGEKPQIQQLAELAADHEIGTVVLSIGGNDLKFSDIVQSCAVNFIANKESCRKQADEDLKKRLSAVREDVARTLDAIHETMGESGQDQSTYDLVVQGYPAPLPPAYEMRYEGDHYDRYTKGGCPFYDEDVSWTGEGAVAEIGGMLRGAARDGDAAFLDLADAFSGHELCAKSAKQATSRNSLDKPIAAEDAEWVRYFSGLSGGGQWQEAVHPNAYGQRALSACLVRMDQEIAESGARSFRCVGSAGSSPDVPIVSSSPIDAAAWDGEGPDSDGRRLGDHVLFQGDSFAYFNPYKKLDGSMGDGNSPGYLTNVGDIGGIWSSLRDTDFAGGVEAAFEQTDKDDGSRQLSLFRGGRYTQVSIEEGTIDDQRVRGPGPIRDYFPVFEGTVFEHGVDAAVGNDKEPYALVFRDGQVGLLEVDLDGDDDKWITEPGPVGKVIPALRGTPFEYSIDSVLLVVADHGKIQADLVSGTRVARMNLDMRDLSRSYLMSHTRELTDRWPSLRGTIFDWGKNKNDFLVQSLRYGPTPPPDPEPVIRDQTARSVSAAAAVDHSKCRPDGMTATKGVETPYCLIYDDQGREVMGERHPRRVVGYFTGWRTGRNGQPMYLPRSIPWGQVSHVNYAFAHVDGSNRISVGDVNDPDNPATGMTWPHVPGAEMDGSLPYKGNFNLLNKYKKKHPRVRTLISVGGWAETGGILKPDGSREKSGGLYRVTNNADGSVNQPAINTFADSVVKFLRTYGFNGVDIDYEYPTSLLDAGNPEDWPIANPRRKGLNAGNTALMKTLREKLDAASAADNAYYQLTAAASASGYLLRGQEDFRALQYLDFVNTMSYDYHGSWNNYVGPQAPLYDDGKDVELAATGIYDKAKNPEYQQEGFFNTDWSYHYFRGAMQAGRINMGVPYYTRGWKDVEGGEGNGLWGISKLKDQSQCPDGTGPNGGTTECGSGASGIDNLWHDQTAAGDELAAGSNPMWHSKNLERGAVTSYLPRFGLDPKDSANGMDGYTRHWDGTLKASWLWHKDKKVFLSTQDTQDIAAKADYIKAKGAGGAMIWELAGDYECPDDKSGQCVPGYTLTKQLDNAQRDAGPYGATRAGKTKLPSQVLDADVTFAKYPTDNKDLWPLQPMLRITNRGDNTIAGGAKVSFDLPTSAPSVIKDGNWQPYKNVKPGHSGPNVGGLKGEFHRVTITLEKCQEIPAGRSMDIPVKYYLPATGPANVTIISEGKTFGITGDRRHGTQTVAPPAGSAECSPVKWDPKDTYDKGDVVTHKGRRWVAEYWANKGDEPGVAPVWRNISPND
ncbi:glycosyl hydrolase family 18 protein [Streptomyces pathocidini]|uniref:Glycosyl hydrolase family 18 protein n=1 Tax=Streptomyces pathocidini TaxID=1650571 RepID=A0ABW7UPM4_9ACTN|nr:glycosyl hydrolase family 18 protein [Streptomyces pathocidini]